MQGKIKGFLYTWLMVKMQWGFVLYETIKTLMNTSKKQAKIWETLVTHNLKEKKINVPAQPYFNTVWSLSYFKRKAEFNTEKTIKYCAMLAYPYCYIRFLSFLEQCVKKVKLMSYFLLKKKKKCAKLLATLSNNKMEIKWKLLLYQSKPLHLYIAGTTQEGIRNERGKKKIFTVYMEKKLQINIFTEAS